MTVDEFDYALPEALIAQRPAEHRDGSRLLCLDRHDGSVVHRTFGELPALLRAGDLLVVNDTRVLPARLAARKASGGRVELLLVERLDAGEDPASVVWSCLGRVSRPPRVGDALRLDGGLTGELLARDGGTWRVRFRAAPGADAGRALLAAGAMPLPPYIRREDGAPPPVDDAERYQTVYAARDGAVAAPTAGLHFTPELLAELESRGVSRVAVTLHVGPGTFQPVRVRDLDAHEMHEERGEIPAATAEAIAATRRTGGRVVAVGTTVVRALEARADASGRVSAGTFRTALFIRPGFRFRVIDALLTNFHLPRSTLLMLVAAFAGREHVLAAYADAVERRYRFFSYGDAMLVA